ncbi:MAG TPA: response regulator transcription factor [Acidimicrobiales bacterium]|nr:response regulator transcription factor [Acidimicrobiales bacterium]
MGVVRLVVADDHSVWRSGLRAELGEGFEVVGEAADVAGAVEVINRERPDLVVCDLCMPGGGGVAVVSACAEVTPIVMLSVSEAEADVLECVAAGAVGYLAKSSTGPALRDALARAAQGEPVFSPGLASLVLGEFRRMGRTKGSRAAVLTDREREVLVLVARGHSYREIGEELFIARKTAENHVRNILAKLHLSRRDQLMRFALDHGLDTTPAGGLPGEVPRGE